MSNHKILKKTDNYTLEKNLIRHIRNTLNDEAAYIGIAHDPLPDGTYRVVFVGFGKRTGGVEWNQIVTDKYRVVAVKTKYCSELRFPFKDWKRSDLMTFLAELDDE